jgi:hypothetical protein
MLLAVYDWFTEGFDTRDLQEAKALLNVLSQEREPEEALFDQASSAAQALGIDELENRKLTIGGKEARPSLNLHLAVVNKGKLTARKSRIQSRAPRVQGKRHK